MKLVTVPIWVIIVTQRQADAFAPPIPSERNVLNVHLIPGDTALQLVVRSVNCFISSDNVFLKIFILVELYSWVFQKSVLYYKKQNYHYRMIADIDQYLGFYLWER